MELSNTTCVKHLAWDRELLVPRETAGGRPILAVVKNNAYGLGDQTVGPILADCPEVGGIACVRVHEGLAMRQAGVGKPILNMAEVSEPEMEELVRHEVTPSVWLDDAPQRIERLARRLGHSVPVQLYIDTGMGREGMPYRRGRQWMETLWRSESAKALGTYTMFVHELEFDREQLARFESIISRARAGGLDVARRLGPSTPPRRSNYSNFPRRTWIWCVRVTPCSATIRYAHH